MMTTLTKLDAALAYASWGWKVIPVVPNNKLPASAHGVKDATNDPELIKRWWSINPDYNIGIAAGKASGIIVFDIDPRNGGNDSWDSWVSENGGIPDGAYQLTAGGGQHYLANYQEFVKSCKLRDGIDLLADGRYFLAHPSTINGKMYEWEASSDPFDGIVPFVIPEVWAAAMSVRKVLDTADRATSGLIQGNRNDGLTAYAGAMRGFGATEGEILAALSVVNELRCDPPLPSSEIKQISRSVMRYESNTDIASNTALGSEAADFILGDAEKIVSEYFLTKATSYLSQPSPLKWIVRDWIPAQATIMIYGESGAGKSFVALDMACCIATGRPWNGKKTKEGIVILLAGEGNYGLRQRIASWCKHNEVVSLDNLLISNKSIDLDSPDSASIVLRAIREMTDQPIAMAIIDTLNNHMSGDENSARDTRAMLNSCNIVGAATGATVGYVHHTGHGLDSKGRARGSSAWKGALDASFLVVRDSADNDVINVSCAKMKDSEEPASFCGKLSRVDLGWFDEDNNPLHGATFTIIDGATPTAPKEKKDNKIDNVKKTFSSAWTYTGCEEKDNKPYISRAGLRSYFESLNMADRTIVNKLNSGYDGGFINILLHSEIISVHDNGWVLLDNVLASSMFLSK